MPNNTLEDLIAQRDELDKKYKDICKQINLAEKSEIGKNLIEGHYYKIDDGSYDYYYFCWTNSFSVIPIMDDLNIEVFGHYLHHQYTRTTTQMAAGHTFFIPKRYLDKAVEITKEEFQEEIQSFKDFIDNGFCI